MHYCNIMNNSIAVADAEVWNSKGFLLHWKKRYGNIAEHDKAIQAVPVRSTMSCQISPMLQKSGSGLWYLFINSIPWESFHVSGMDIINFSSLVMGKTSHLCLSLPFSSPSHSLFPPYVCISLCWDFQPHQSPSADNLCVITFFTSFAWLLHVLTPFFPCGGKEAFAPCMLSCRVWFPWHFMLLNPGSYVIWWTCRFTIGEAQKTTKPFLAYPWCKNKVLTFFYGSMRLWRATLAHLNRQGELFCICL